MPSSYNTLRSTAAVIIPFASRFRDGRRGQSLATQARTSSALRQMYRSFIDLPVPGRLTDLLARPKKRPQRS